MTAPTDRDHPSGATPGGERIDRNERRTAQPAGPVTPHLGLPRG
jgi:hypothetical protein